jgi:phosphohistidine phosphatase
MPRLILMRHAKSDWSFSAPDHDRALNARGRKSAAALGQWLHREGHKPQEAFVSTSLRTRQSWDLLGLSCVVHYAPALYHAEAETILEVLRGAERECVLLLGHNPGICAFAHLMVAEAPCHERFADYPTGATLVADVAARDWSALEPRSGRVVDFVVPRELNDRGAIHSVSDPGSG